MKKINSLIQLFVFFLLITASFSAKSFAAKKGAYTFETTHLPYHVFHGRRFYVSMGVETSARPFQFVGTVLGAGYQWDYLGVDFKATFAGTPYGSIRSDADPTNDFGSGNVSFDNPNSQLNRARTNDEAWNVTLFEPGVNVHGRLFHGITPLLTQRARFGIGFGTFSDTVNGFTFSALTYAFEAGLQYQFGYGSRWALDLGLTHRSGWINDTQEATSQMGRLPVNFVNWKLTLRYWL